MLKRNIVYLIQEVLDKHKPTNIDEFDWQATIEKIKGNFDEQTDVLSFIALIDPIFSIDFLNREQKGFILRNENILLSIRIKLVKFLHEELKKYDIINPQIMYDFKVGFQQILLDFENKKNLLIV